MKIMKKSWIKWKNAVISWITTKLQKRCHACETLCATIIRKNSRIIDLETKLLAVNHKGSLDALITDIERPMNNQVDAILDMEWAMDELRNMGIKI